VGSTVRVATVRTARSVNDGVLCDYLNESHMYGIIYINCTKVFMCYILILNIFIICFY